MESGGIGMACDRGYGDIKGLMVGVADGVNNRYSEMGIRIVGRQ